MIYNGCLYHIVRAEALESDIPPIKSVSIVRDSLEVFSDDLPVIPP